MTASAPAPAPRSKPSKSTPRGSNPPAPESMAVQAARLAGTLDASVQRALGAADHNLGHLETQVAHDVQALLNETLRRGAQAKADVTPRHGPECGRPLTRCSSGHARTIQTRFGEITVQRTRGCCKHCGKWRIPAEQALGLADTTAGSPGVQSDHGAATSASPGGRLAGRTQVGGARRCPPNQPQPSGTRRRLVQRTQPRSGQFATDHQGMHRAATASSNSGSQTPALSPL